MPNLLRGLSRALFEPGGPYLFVRLVLAGYAISAIGRLLPVRRKQTTEYRRRPRRTVALGATGLAVAAAAVTAPYLLASSATAVVRPTSHQPAGRKLSQGKYLGVFEPDEELFYEQVQAFGVAAGRQPDSCWLMPAGTSHSLQASRARCWSTELNRSSSWSQPVPG